MSLFPIEKFASDRLGDAALEKIGGFWAGNLGGTPFSRLGGMALRGMGRFALGAAKLTEKGAWGAAMLAGRSAQGLGVAAVKHPKTALAVGAPMAYSAYKFPETFQRYSNNVVPQLPYRY